MIHRLSACAISLLKRKRDRSGVFIFSINRNSDTDCRLPLGLCSNVKTIGVFLSHLSTNRKAPTRCDSLIIGVLFAQTCGGSVLFSIIAKVIDADDSLTVGALLKRKKTTGSVLSHLSTIAKQTLDYN
ncbi:hypothetical protein AVEN_141534-1 [Araneus ventricosus]|uniref:Uncharacterized protein n=1 Tax=Araneus ventricosus TaxID=182803 RepID=A0A4Y2HZS5_ARAVE|nr:hypothetical protein AVEN_141534-1 [Araneus ventricosus]